jgi:hypothetical protein
MTNNVGWSHSWYEPGNWKLPEWWISDIPTRGDRSTWQEQNQFYSGPFVRNVLGHTGGISIPPKIIV